MDPRSAPQAIESECEVLGVCLHNDSYLNLCLAELHLAPEHFYMQRHGLIWEVMVALHDEGKRADELLVVADLERRGKLEEAGGKHYVPELSAAASVFGPALGNHAELVIQKAAWRERLAAGQLIQVAALDEDNASLLDAEERLATEVTHGSSDFDPDALADIAYSVLEGGGVESFGWPFERLNQLTSGGIRRGELVVVAGHTSHGKSVLLDQILDTVARQGKAVRLYMNEMDLEQRVSRALTRRTGVPYGRIVQGRTSDEQKKRVLAELNRGLPWGITTCAGWTAAEVGHHIRRRRWDLCVVDHLHEFDYEGEEDIRRMISGFARVAKLANCAVVVGAQLNERRVQTAVLPRPTISDLKGSSQIKQAADTICFVYREQDPDTAEPLPGSAVYLGKGRNQEVGGLKAMFDPHRLRFVLPDDETRGGEPG